MLAEHAREVADGEAKTAAAHEQTLRSARKGMLTESLGNASWGKYVVAAVIILCLGGPGSLLVIYGPRSDGAMMATALVGAIAIITVAIAMPQWVMQWIAAARIANLRKIGLGIDVERYLELLSDKRRTGRLVVRIHFARPWDADRQTAADAVSGWLPAVELSGWDGDVLQIGSGELNTTIELPSTKFAANSKMKEFSNAAIHGCLMNILDTVIPKLNAVCPISTLDVSVDGRALAWDANA